MPLQNDLGHHCRPVTYLPLEAVGRQGEVVGRGGSQALGIVTYLASTLREISAVHHTRNFLLFQGPRGPDGPAGEQGPRGQKVLTPVGCPTLP